MTDKELDNLLFELGNYETVEPVNLVQKTTEKIQNKNLIYLIILAMFLNLTGLFSLIILIYIKYSFTGIIAVYITFSFLQSLTIIPIIALKDNLKNLNKINLNTILNH
ncbi:hypothetical protein SAMN02745163_00496 [Clostridium cavendishii DSM 21758]|uniref:Uncharacterized protein n=1 Tax=Clostridium cavendishii DSM 21758 TaxID=1121302 RepID=A0A1M6CM41_9CLOT|nr:hypothetical protein [Clostridium cavendishii]SHI61844.1 hypothetical protein SAMN02745163_00496 [Clostridium cavendishii DSM 21758]